MAASSQKICVWAGQGASTVTRLSADGLQLLGPPLELPEGSMGRIASDLTDEGEFIYIPGYRACMARPR